MSAELRIQLCQISPSAAEAVIGAHRVIVDRPSSKGGSDMGPMGGELFLAAIAGCFMSNLHPPVGGSQRPYCGQGRGRRLPGPFFRSGSCYHCRRAGP
jgi:hypothetical protein